MVNFDVHCNVHKGNELKSIFNLADKHQNICTQFASRCMQDKSKKIISKGRKQDIARVKQLYIQKSLERS